MKKNPLMNFMASVTNDYMNSMDVVADNLRNKGCEITGIHRLTGVITGKVSHTTDLNILKVDGIASLEKQQRVKKAR